MTSLTVIMHLSSSRPGYICIWAPCAPIYIYTRVFLSKNALLQSVKSLYASVCSITIYRAHKKLVHSRVFLIICLPCRIKSYLVRPEGLFVGIKIKSIRLDNVGNRVVYQLKIDPDSELDRTISFVMRLRHKTWKHLRL